MSCLRRDRSVKIRLRCLRGCMIPGANAVLAIVDSAEPFLDVHPLAGEDLRRAGLAALNEQLDALRAAAPLALEERQKALQEASTAIGGIIAAEAIVEAFAKAALEDAAAGAGLIRDLGVRETRRAIAAAIKAGKKIPRTFTGPAAAAQDAIPSQPRPGDLAAEAQRAKAAAGNSAADRITSSDTAAEPAPSSSRSASPPFAADPAPAAEGDELNGSSQTGASSNASADARGAGDTDPP